MPELPTGTVTFLFSDIEGSTRLAVAQGEAWPPLLARHQELLRAAYDANGGIEVGTEGDSFFVVFRTAVDAIAAAVAAQRALAGEPWPPGSEVRIRIGIHSGEANLSTDTYVGLDVHRAARIGAAGHGGQTLVSDVTRALVEQSLPDGVSLRDLGEHRLKDLAARERLWQLVAPGLEVDFPVLGSLDATPNNLPTRLTTFLGREREIAQVNALLADARLLTLTGPGGTGKTRLSLEVAARLMSRFPDGVWFVELAPISEPELVPATIAQVLGLPDRGGQTQVERLLEHIGDKRVLLILDNFEQVVLAAPALAELLRGAPNLTMLVSSRSVLRLYGEREFPVPPLGLPDPAHLPADVAALSQYEAVALFIERARAVRPDFAVTNENAPAVAEICVRLDGLPLAIELAAARIRILGPQAILARLERRLALLSSAGTHAQDLPERQRTLRGAIAWSHDMLDESDRMLFACLSVFVGGASPEGLEQVCSSRVSGEILDALASLVEKSLVRQLDGLGGEPRFAMLETIREFAMEQAVELGIWDDLRRAHGELFCGLADEAAKHVMGSEKRAWLDRLEQDHGNLRAASTWAVETGQAVVALRTSAALWRFWQMRGYLAEGLERVQAALALPGAADHPEERARALDAAGGIAYWLADTMLARRFYEEELAAWRALGDEKGAADTLYSLVFTYTFEAAADGVIPPDKLETARRLLGEALEIFRRLDDRAGMARCLWALSSMQYGSGRPEEGRTMALEALEIFRELGDRFMEGWAVYTAGFAHLVATVDGEYSPEVIDVAEAEMAEALRIFHEAQDLSGYALVLDGFATIAARRGDLQRAARISGSVAAIERTSGTGLNFLNRHLVQFRPEALRDDPRTADAYAEGERLSTAEAVAYALDTIPAPSGA